MSTFQKIQDLFDEAADNILSKVYFFDTLAELKETLPPILIRHLQAKFFSYHKKKEEETIANLIKNQVYAPLSPDSLKRNGFAYRVESKYVECSQWTSREDIPTEVYPPPNYPDYSLRSFYCEECWHTIVAKQQPTLETVKVKITLKNSVKELTGWELDQCKYRSACYLCSKPIVKVIECYPKEGVFYPSDYDMLKYW